MQVCLMTSHHTSKHALSLVLAKIFREPCITLFTARSRIFLLAAILRAALSPPPPPPWQASRLRKNAPIIIGQQLLGQCFVEATERFGWPFRVRSDKGGENIDVELFMFVMKGLNTGAVTLLAVPASINVLKDCGEMSSDVSVPCTIHCFIC